MYFSLIAPAEGRERDAAHEWARHAYADHQWIWRLFSLPPGSKRPFLFRRSEIGGLPRFHVVSRDPPCSAPEGWNVRSREYAPSLIEGDRLRFELRANATVRRGRDAQSKRHDIVMDAKKRLLDERGLSRWSDLPDGEAPALYRIVHETGSEWLSRQGRKHGFAVDEDSLVTESYQQQGSSTGRGLQFSSIDFRGELTVEDPSALVKALFEGIGPAKAFGCGLLLIRRLD